MKKITIILLLLFSFALGYGFRNFSENNSSDLKRATSIGGIFFKCKDPVKVREWYAKHLGFKIDQYGTLFEWRLATDSTKKGFTQWSPFSEKTKYFEPSQKDFMINYRVDNLEKLIVALRNEGVTITDTMETFDYGKFIHIMDIEGNKIELWEPPLAEYFNNPAGITK